VADAYVKRNDTQPVLERTLLDVDDAPVNLTGATVKFIMRKPGASTAKVSAAATVVTPLAGEVSYQWTGTDTDTAGTYNGEFEVTFSGGAKQTFPNDGHLKIEVVEDLG
jgi:hypothetical protein